MTSNLVKSYIGQYITLLGHFVVPVVFENARPPGPKIQQAMNVEFGFRLAHWKIQ